MTSPPAETGDVDEPPPARHGRTARDMAISLVVLLIPVAIIVAFVWGRGGNDVVPVDPGTAIADARRAAAFPVLAPRPMAAGWTSVSAQYTPDDTTLRIGYVTPAGHGLQLIESASPQAGLLIRELGDAVTPDGVMAVGGQQWNSYQVRNGERALVLPGSGRTIIVIGSAEPPELRALAASVS